jgi:hypothetical protein
LWICQQVTLLWLEKFMLWLRKGNVLTSHDI